MNNWATLVNKMMFFIFFGIGTVWIFPVVNPSDATGWALLIIFLAIFACMLYYLYRFVSSRRQKMMESWVAFCKKYNFRFKENKNYYHTCDMESMQGKFGGRDFFFWSEDRAGGRIIITLLILKTKINSNLSFVGKNFSFFNGDLVSRLKKEAGGVTNEMEQLIKEKTLALKIGSGELVLECRCDENIPERMLLAASSFADFLENKKH